MRLAITLIILLLMSGLALLQLDQVTLDSDIVANVDSLISQEPDLSDYAKAYEGQPIRFPQDLGAHPEYFIEWWYYTGNLKADNGEPFGYQFTIFRRALSPQPIARPSEWASNQIYFAHFTVTDGAGETFEFHERFSRGGPGLAGVEAQPYRVWMNDWSVHEIAGAASRFLSDENRQGIPAQVQLQAQAGEIGLDLTLELAKPVTLQGDKGLSAKSSEPGNASYYYSLTNQHTHGTVTTPRGTFAVSGSSWKDHEWSSSVLPEGGLGWDWFALKLNNQTEVMFFYIRLEGGTIEPVSKGTLILPDGTTRLIPKDSVIVETLDTWESPRSGAVYPIEWNFAIPDEGFDLHLKAIIPQQELRVSTTYWEGAVQVNGSHTGAGYVELTGYNESIQGRLRGAID